MVSFLADSVLPRSRVERVAADHATVPDESIYVHQAILGCPAPPGHPQLPSLADDAPVTALELLNLNREPIPEDAASRALDDPWEGIADTAKIRRELGFRPIYPTVYTAKDAGAL